MEPVNCPECARLKRDVEEVLQQEMRLASTQLEAFRKNETERFLRLDKELESVMGAKQRIIGAVREHDRAHEKSLR